MLVLQVYFNGLQGTYVFQIWYWRWLASGALFCHLNDLLLLHVSHGANGQPKNVKIILEWKATCRHHRWHPKHRLVWPMARGKEVITAVQHKFSSYSFGDFLWRRHGASHSKTIFLFSMFTQSIIGHSVSILMKQGGDVLVTSATHGDPHHQVATSQQKKKFEFLWCNVWL